MNCPKCNGPMYDNRKTKKNAKQPDFKCKNREGCDHAIWPDSKDYPKNVDAAPNGGAPAPNAQAESVGSFLKRAAELLGLCHSAARTALKGSYEGEDGRSLFIETNKAMRDGYVARNEKPAEAATVSADLEGGEGVDL
jgi:hypothetical protein